MSFSTLNFCFPGAQLITFMREPRSRILSHWLYWRSQTDEHIAAWGDWGRRVYNARLSLLDFLFCEDVACQIDNLTLRMLLWPHPLIPPNGFIVKRNDKRLVDEAVTRLHRFAYVDLVENPRIQTDLSNWCLRPVTYSRMNKTANIPAYLKIRLDHELTPEAYSLLNARARLDLKVWMTIALQRELHVDPASACEYFLLKNISRYSLLMAG